MTEKELRRLKRVELLDMLIEQGKLVEAQNKEIFSLKERNANLEKRLQDTKIDLEATGSLAEASVRIARLFDAADKAALIYLDNLRERSGSPISAREALMEAINSRHSGIFESGSKA